MDSQEKLGQMLREANLQVMQLQQQVTSLHSEMNALKSRSLKEEEVSRLKLGEVKQKLESLDKWNLTIRDLDDIPGIRTPRWYEVDVDLAANATQTTFNTAEISPDGPFIITQIQPYFEITDTDAANFPVSNVAPTGRILPCSAFPLLLSQLGSDVGGVASDLDTYFNAGSGPFTEVPELSFQFEIAGSGRFWTNRAIPAASLYGESNPLYTGIAGWVERTDRIVVHVTPTATLPYAGRVRMVFHGY